MPFKGIRNPKTQQERKAAEAAKTDEILIPWRACRCGVDNLPSNRDDMHRSVTGRDRQKALRLTHRRQSRKFVEQLKLGERLLVIESQPFVEEVIEVQDYSGVHYLVIDSESFWDE